MFTKHWPNILESRNVWRGRSSDMRRHRDRSGDWRWAPRTTTADFAFNRSLIRWVVAAGALILFVWMGAGNSRSSHSASLASYCGRTAESDVQAETYDCGPCASGTDVNAGITFVTDMPSQSGSVNVWLFQGPGRDGDSISVDGPVCDVETSTPPVDGQATTPTTPPPDSDLAISKADQPDPVAPGGTLAYSIMVTNISDVDAENVVMTDSLPAGVTLISATPSQGTCAEATCDLGTLAAHETAAISVVATLDPGAPTLLTNVACVATSTNESNLSNNCDDEKTGVPAPTPPSATQPTEAPSDLPQGGGMPGADTTGRRLAIAGAIALLIAGLAAAFASRRKTDQA